jgi:hypothetical protein
MYSQSAHLSSDQLERKNGPTHKTIKMFAETPFCFLLLLFAESQFAETLHRFGYHFADTSISEIAILLLNAFC